MAPITIWILVSITLGGYNGGGSMSVIDRFPSQSTCESTRAQLAYERTQLRCVSAIVIREAKP